MKKILIVLSILVYLIFINTFSYLYSNVSYQEDNKLQSNSGDVKVGVGDSIKVDVVRNRFYGKYYETYGTNYKTSYLYLLWFIKLPIIINDMNFLMFHIPFILIIILILMKGGFKYEKPIQSIDSDRNRNRVLSSNRRWK